MKESWLLSKIKERFPMTETIKIARACFVGGALFIVVALLVAPTFWWLGALAGFAAGYLAHEMRETLQAISVAFRAAIAGGENVWSDLCEVKENIREYFSKPHPFVYYGVAIGFLTNGFFFYCFPPPQNPVVNIYRTIFGAAMIYVLLTFIAMLCLLICLQIQMRHEKVFCEAVCDQKTIREGKDKGYPEVTLTYGNVPRYLSRLLLRGLYFVLFFFIWHLWRGIAIGALVLIKTIHSNKRLLCGIDGVIGGTIVWFTLAQPIMPLELKLLLVLFGGCLGAVIGVINWELVSKRVFGYGLGT